MNNKQKFHRGDIVHIAKDLGQEMSHFENDQDAIVMGSYADKFGGNDTDEYTILLKKTGSEVSWYYEHQLTLIKHGNEKDIQQILKDKDIKKKRESKLEWIVNNWQKMKKDKSYSPFAIAKLMELIGINNPWGNNGEYYVYWINSIKTITYLDPIISTGDIKKVKTFLKERKIKEQS